MTQCYRETWQNLTELVFVDTMSTKKYGRQLSVKTWRVQENPTTLTIVMQYLLVLAMFLAVVLVCLCDLTVGKSDCL